MDIKRLDVNAKLQMYETAKREKDAAKNNADTSKNTAQKTENHDRITISSEAKNLNFIDFAKSKIKYEMKRDLPDISSERLNALKDQIKSGEYMISSKDIAAAVISGGQEA